MAEVGGTHTLHHEARTNKTQAAVDMQHLPADKCVLALDLEPSEAVSVYASESCWKQHC